MAKTVQYPSRKISREALAYLGRLRQISLSMDEMTKQSRDLLIQSREVLHDLDHHLRDHCIWCARRYGA